MEYYLLIIRKQATMPYSEPLLEVYIDKENLDIINDIFKAAGEGFSSHIIMGQKNFDTETELKKLYTYFNEEGYVYKNAEWWAKTAVATKYMEKTETKLNRDGAYSFVDAFEDEGRLKVDEDATIYSVMEGKNIDTYYEVKVKDKQGLVTTLSIGSREIKEFKQCHEDAFKKYLAVTDAVCKLVEFANEHNYHLPDGNEVQDEKSNESNEELYDKPYIDLE